MDIKQFIFYFLNCSFFCQSFLEGFSNTLYESENIKNFIKDQFQESCFGTKSFNLMKSRLSRAKSECSFSPGSTTTEKHTQTTSVTTSLPATTTNPTTFKTSSPRWSWMPPAVTQFPAFQNVHLVNPVQFYPQTFQYKVRHHHHSPPHDQS